MSESDRSRSDIFNQIASDFFDIEQIYKEVESQRLRARPEAQAFTPPRTPLEELLASIWTVVLGVERAGVHDNFFDLGGSSILGTQLLSRIHEKLGVELPLRVLFESPPTIADLAARIETLKHAHELNGLAIETIPVPRNQSDSAFPLSYAQQRLWFLHHLEPDGDAYKSVFAFRIRGALDLPALDQSLSEIVRRHETLRTTFRIIDGGPAQVVLHRPGFSLHEADLYTLSEHNRQTVTSRLIQSVFGRNYSLDRGALFRVHLVRQTDDESVLIIAAHHIVFDGWSLGVFASELAALYKGFKEGEGAPCEEIRVQYADFSAWQRARLEPELLEAQLRYWREQLDGLSVLILPTDKPRPLIRTNLGARESVALSSDLTAGLRDLGRREGATLFMTLLTGFCALLHRYSGQEDVAIGSPIANRTRVEAEKMIGFFVNTLVLRLNLSPRTTVGEALADCRRIVLGAFDNQDLPFEKLVDELAPERDLSTAPLFQVMFILQNTPPSAFALPGLEIESIPFEDGSVKFDLVLSLTESGSNLFATLEYATDLYEAPSMRRLLAHLEVLLDGMRSRPNAPLSELPILTRSERQQLLVDWCDTKAGYSLDPCIHEMIAEQAERTPESIALVFEDDSVTYREMNSRANQLAHHLRGAGIGTEKLAGICLDRGLEMLIAVIGVLKTGGAYVPLDPDYPVDRLKSMIDDAGLSAMVTVERFLGVVSGFGGRTIYLDSEREAIAAQSDADPPNSADSQNLAYVIYTSGSTGRPKGVMISHRAMNNLVLWMQEMFQIGGSDSLLQKTPFSFDPSVWEFFWPLVTGATLVIARPGGHLESGYMVELVIERGVTILQLVPSVLQLLVDEPEFDRCESLRLVYCGAEALSPALIEKFYSRLGSKLSNVYGPTEAAMHVTLWPCETRPDGLVSIGRGAGNVETYLVSSHLEPMPLGIPGELQIGGAQLARGYLGAPDLTAEKFVPGPFCSDAGARVYRTGDLARYLDDGNIEFLGRIDHQVKIRGFRIEPAEIEAALSRHDLVQDSLVMVTDDAAGRRRLVAYIVAPRDDQALKEDLRRYLKQTLPPFMIPGAFVIIDRLPLMPNGKVDRRALPLPDEASASIRTDYLAPRNRVEQLLADIWCQVLGVEQAGANDNFFEMGGDSILSILIIARANRAGLRLTPKQLFEHQTIAELALAAGDAQSIEAEQGIVTGPAPLTPIQAAYFEHGSPQPHHFNQSVMLEAREPLDSGCLERAVGKLVAHHDALRLRFRREGSEWLQWEAGIDGPGVFSQVDLTALSEPLRVLEHAAEEVQTSLDLQSGPLIRVVLFSLGNAASRLLIVIHHLAVDGVSWRILLEDLTAAYQQALRGEAVALPPKTTSFKQWSERVREFALSQLSAADAAYWSELSPEVCTDLPIDFESGSNIEESARTTVVTLKAEETDSLLHRVPPVYHTEINDVLIAAAAAALSDWIGRQYILIDVEGHGRQEIFEDLDVSRTVGWFTTVHPVAIEASRAGDSGDLLKSVKEQLRAVPRKGFTYGLLRRLAPGINPGQQEPAQVCFNYLGQFDQVLAGGSLFSRATESDGLKRSPGRRREYLIEINAAVVQGRLRIAYTYSANRHRADTIERLAAMNLSALREILEHCLSPEAGGYTPSDFPLTSLTQEETDWLLRRYPDLEDAYPLSPMQQGLLFHVLHEPGTEEYFEQFSCRLRGKLEPEIFRKAWNRVVNRHTLLRTAFCWEHLRGVAQIVMRRVTLEWQDIDWRTRLTDEADAGLDDFLKADRRRGFSLGEAPLMRIALIRLADDEHELVWSHHHLLLDGWSAPIVVREVFAVYNGYITGSEIDLEPTRSYRAYIEWLGRQDFDSAKSFWQLELKGFTGRSALDIGRAGSGAASLHRAYNEERVLLSQQATASLQAMARGSRVTVNTVLQGAWAALLSRYSRESDIVFGATVSGRSTPLAGVDRMVGLFINTLPVRIIIDGGEPLDRWLRAIQRRQAGVRQFEHTPLSEIQSWCGATPGDRLFDSLLAFENYPIDLALGEEIERRAQLNVIRVRAKEQTNYPLTLIVSPAARLSIRLIYDTGWFDACVVLRMLAHFETLLQDMIASPNAPVRDIQILTESERRQLLIEWNDTSNENRVLAPIQQLFEGQVYLTPDRIAVVHEQETVSYAELNRKANQLARHLSGLGVAPETKVAVCLSRGVEMVVALLAILKSGGAYVPLDPDYPAHRLAFVLRDSKAAVLITEKGWLENQHLGHAVGIVLMDESEAINRLDDENLPANAELRNLAYVIYTSGSTGMPKGVAIEHRNTAAFLDWARRVFNPDELASVLASTSLCFDLSVFEIFAPLSTGGKVVIVRNALELAESTAAGQVTLINTVPSAARELLRLNALPSSVVTVNLAGEPLQRSLVDDLYSVPNVDRVFNLYGPSEDTTYSTGALLDKRERREPVIGRPIADTRVFLLDPEMRLAPLGVAAELHLAGAGLCRGYLGRPDLTAERFLPNHLGDEPGARLYRTGDLARYSEDGCLEYLRRLDQQVKIRGYRIELGEIESWLTNHPAVRECVVTAREDRPGDKRLVAYAAADLDFEFTSAQVSEVEREHVSHWQSLNDLLYQRAGDSADAGFNLAGWNDSYTGSPFPDEVMREWLGHTVDQILALRPKRVLEIGCGTGLILLRLAPHCDLYQGSDFSREALAYVRRELESGESRFPVELLHRQADDFSGIEPRSLDLVVLNSVVQYFPTIEYLLRTIEQAARSVKPGGRIFIGDVRSLPLLEAFHASVQLHQAHQRLDKSQLRQRIHKRIAMEQELAITPKFFLTLSARVPEITGAQCRLKRGNHHNELTNFRYDVVIEVGGARNNVEPVSWLDWTRDALTFDSIEGLLRSGDEAIVAIKSAPNARVRAHVETAALINSDEGPETTREIRDALETSGSAIDPERMRSLGASHGYHVDITWDGENKDGSYDLVFSKPGSEQHARSCLACVPDVVPSLRACANKPIHEMLSRKLIPQLREYARASLPDHMVPAAFVMMAELPMTPNGKVDRRSLPSPEQDRPEMDQVYVGPRTEGERILAQVWEEFLGVAPIGVNDNFFELGGDSILSIQVIASANERGLRLTSRELFEHPTVAGLASLAQAEPADTDLHSAPDADAFGWTQANLDEIAAAIDRSLSNESGAD